MERSLLRRAFTFMLVLASAVGADLQTIVVGEGGDNWGSEGDITPSIIRTGNRAVDRTNTPGGVIDFDRPDWRGWVFPQEVDSTLNIMPGLTDLERGGSLTTPTFSFKSFKPAMLKMIDDDGRTALEVRPERAGESTKARGFIMQFDLGAIFALTRIKFFPRNADPAYPAPLTPNQQDFLKSFEILENDGSLQSQAGGILQFDTFVDVGRNDEQIVDLRFEPQRIRHVRLKVTNTAEFEIAEFQAFAQGFVPTATYVSNVFDFGQPALLGNLRWRQHQLGDPERSQVRVRTRTGVDVSTVVYPRVGLQPSGRTNVVDAEGGLLEEEVPIEALWKRADAIADPGLRTVVEETLENPELDGREVLLFYNGLPLEQRAELEIDEGYYQQEVVSANRRDLREDLTNWSAWSSPYEISGIVDDAAMLAETGVGVNLVSPSPRRYFQFMVEFDNQDFDTATGIGGLSFDVQTPALTDSLIAEILPRTTVVGEPTRFTYAILNKVAPGRDGFNRIEVDTPIRIDRLMGIEVEIRGSGEGQRLVDFADVSLEAPFQPVIRDEITIDEVRDDGFVISFPRIESDALLKIEFESAVLRYGTVFSARARDAGNDMVGQEVIPGNAADLSGPDLADPDTQPVGSLNPRNLSVSVPITRDLLVNVAAEPAVFTPNGDDINESALIRYDITNIEELRRIKVEIFDLSGRRVRKLYDDGGLSGRFARAWDALDDAGQLVPPGSYLFRVTLNAATGDQSRTGIVAVAY